MAIKKTQSKSKSKSKTPPKPAKTSGPAWDLASEYKSVDDTALEADLARVHAAIKSIDELSLDLAIAIPTAERLTPDQEERLVPIAQRVSILRDEATTLLGNVTTFAHCVASVYGSDAKARALVARCQTVQARFAQVSQPLSLLLTRANDTFVTKYLARPETRDQSFEIAYARKDRDRLLPMDQENLILALEVDGKTAWGNLHENIQGTLRCSVREGSKSKTMGISAARVMLGGSDPKRRKAAYEAINSAWSTQSEACAGVLNALTGWRQEVCRRRSHTVPTRYLDAPLRAGRLSSSTLDTMFDVVRSSRDVGQRAMRLVAKAHGTKRLGPWDLMMPAPTARGQKPAPGRTFAEGITLVANAFADVHPNMGEFVRMMASKGWIEGRVLDSKRAGAYCTDFIKSRTPRVFMTYTGTTTEVSTLAHELGHAFHSWVMRDLPLAQLSYPMTLAETASIFAETVVKDSLMAGAKSPNEILPILHDEAADAAAFLLNIPARFDFEVALNEARALRVLTADDMRSLTEKAWRDWYGDTLSEMDPMFWASKMHFHLAELSFYNFPYTFGYLFSLGVYARRAQLGDRFYDAYVALLRDTGRMTAEEVAERHLGVDITKPAFWRDSVAIVTKKLDHLERVMKR